jgi:shikimate dehydrogenase
VTGAPGRLLLLGHPVSHSLSPRFQNAALHAARIALTYEAIDVAPHDVDRLLGVLVSENAAGNVTLPYKAHVARACHRLTPIAERSGAVNTFWTEEGRLVGDNTDVGGFDAAARALLGTTPCNTTIALLGAGGAAAGVLAAIERWEHCRVQLYNRTVASAQTLAARFPTLATLATSAQAAMAGATLVVNATSLGLHDQSLPVAIDAIPANAAVLDLVYHEGETAFVRAARARGLRAADGLRMLVEQGAFAFERWFGFAPDRDVMWTSVSGGR